MENQSQMKKTINAKSVEPRTTSNYPEPFASMMSGRSKRALGDLFGIKKYGVNLTTIKPGARSSLLHRHSKAEEFIYVLRGQLILITETEEIVLEAGDCAGFTPTSSAHTLLNRSNDEAEYLEVGDREPGDVAEYPADDIKAALDENNKWVFTHKDGTKY